MSLVSLGWRFFSEIKNHTTILSLAALASLANLVVKINRLPLVAVVSPTDAFWEVVQRVNVDVDVIQEAADERDERATRIGWVSLVVDVAISCVVISISRTSSR